MDKVDPKEVPPRRRVPFWLIVFLLGVLSSGFFYVSGHLGQRSLKKEVTVISQKAEALADSLDGTRTHLVLGAALASVRIGDFESAQTLTSEFFDRVDGRTRREGIAPAETESRMELLALRDRAISALSRKAPEAGRILEDLTNRHLGLVDPELKARTPRPTPGIPARDSLRQGTTRR